MKKTLSLVSAILMTTFTVFLFTPIIFTVKYHKNITPGVGHAGLEWTKSANIFELNILFTILIIILALSSIVVLVLQYLEYKNKKLNKLTFLPDATCLIFIVACISRFLFTKPHGKPEGTATWGEIWFL